MLRKNQADFWVLEKIHRPTSACASRQGQLESLGIKHKTNMRRLWKAERRQTGWGRRDPRKERLVAPLGFLWPHIPDRVLQKLATQKCQQGHTEGPRRAGPQPKDRKGTA